MQAEGTLQTLAEVSVALAGFSSLLVVLRRGPVAELSRGEGSDLFIVVGGNLLVLVFALLPMPLHHLGLADGGVFRGASGGFAVALALGYVAVLRVRGSLLTEGSQPSFPGMSRWLVHAPVLVVVLLAANAAGALGERSTGVYVLALLLVVALASLPLLLVMVDLVASRRS